MRGVEMTPSPSARRRAEDCVCELREQGIGEIPFDPLRLAPLAEAFSKLPIEQMFVSESGNEYAVETPQGTATFVVAHTAVTDRMRWFWACDEATLELFDAAASECLATLKAAVTEGSSLMLFSACFVVVRGTHLSLDQVKSHIDWGHPRIQVGEAFTCMTPLDPFPSSVGGLHVWPWNGEERVHRYQFGSYATIDGKLMHRTEPFDYVRGGPEEAAVCEAYENGGHLRVLVSLSIASDSERLAPYTHKVMRSMTPAATLVRDNPTVFLDSESEQWTSADEGSASSSDESAEGCDARKMDTVLQTGTWSGMLHASHTWDDAQQLCLDLAFDLEDGGVYHKERCIGNVEHSLGAWHVVLDVGQSDGSYLLLSGEFVRSSSSVFLQGRYRDSGGGSPGVFCLSLPKPWRVLYDQWLQLPMPRRTIGLPSDPGAVEVSWGGQDLRIAGRTARWNEERSNPPCGPRTHGDSGKWLARGPGVVLTAACTDTELGTLSAGCCIVVPETVQRRGTFERLHEAADVSGCAAILFLQSATPRRRLPRAARARGEKTLNVPGFTVVLGHSIQTLAGLDICVRSAAL